VCGYVPGVTKYCTINDLQLLTSVTQVWITGQVMWDLWWTKWKTGAEFLQVLQFPLPVLILLTVPYSLIILSLMLYSLATDSVIKKSIAGHKIESEVPSEHRFREYCEA
jgi:hypothetical protein